MTQLTGVAFDASLRAPTQDGSGGVINFPGKGYRPLAFFAGIWTRWTSVRKVIEGETTNNLFGFLTTEPNAIVGAVHAKAMPVIKRPERHSKGVAKSQMAATPKVTGGASEWGSIGVFTALISSSRRAYL